MEPRDGSMGTLMANWESCSLEERDGEDTESSSTQRKGTLVEGKKGVWATRPNGKRVSRMTANLYAISFVSIGWDYMMQNSKKK